MRTPEQGMVLAHHRSVILSNRRGVILDDRHRSGERRNTTKDLFHIFQESAPCLAGLRKQLTLRGDKTEKHPAFDLNIKRLGDSPAGQIWRAVDIAQTMPPEDAGAVWATLCFYEQRDGHYEIGNDRYGGIEVTDRRVEAEWNRVRKQQEERGHNTIIEERHGQHYSRTFMSLRLGRGYFEAGDRSGLELPVHLQQLERERNRFYFGKDPDENAVMRMIGVCVTSDQFTDTWHEAEKQPSAAEGAHYLWNSGVFAPRDASAPF